MRLAALLLCAACARAGATYPPGSDEEVQFSLYTPLSSASEIARRMLPGRKLYDVREQSIDLAQEKFALYVPGGPPPPRGWALIVWVPPWNKLTHPDEWRGALDRHRMVFVSARNSGNDTSLYDRRLPLALLGFANVASAMPVDRERVFVGGFSGGSRVAEIAALAYPDVFRGAMLHAGSDTIEDEKFLPPPDLLSLFLRSRLVFVTGESDEAIQRGDEAARMSLRALGATNIATIVARRLGHDPLDAASFTRALDALDR